MARLIIVGVLLSILSGVAFCVTPLEIAKMRDEVCNKEPLKDLIKCDAISGVSQGGNFSSDSGVVIFATVEPRYSSDPKFIWKVIGAKPGSKGKVDTLALVAKKEIRVALKLPLKKPPPQDHKLRKIEEENLKALSAFGLAPARYVVGNKAGPIETDVTIMELIDGMTLADYIVEAGKMRGLEGHDMETRLRLPGLRLLYIHTETMLLLQKLHAEGWRHCNLDPRKVMIRKKPEETNRELKEQLRRKEQKKDQMEEAWIALQLEAHSIVVDGDNEKAYYQTDNRHMLFTGTIHAQHVGNPRVIVCHGPSDISRVFDSRIFDYWKDVPAEVDENHHLTRVREALKEIFESRAGLRYAAEDEEQELKQIIGELKTLEEKERKSFITPSEDAEDARKRSSKIQTVPGRPREQRVPQLQPTQPHGTAEGRGGTRGELGLLQQQLRGPQHAQLKPEYRTSGEATRTDRLAAGSPIAAQAVQIAQGKPQTQAWPPSQHNAFMAAYDVPKSLSIRKEAPEKQGVLLPKQPQQYPLLPHKLPQIQQLQLQQQRRQPEQQKGDSRDTDPLSILFIGVPPVNKLSTWRSMLHAFGIVPYTLVYPEIAVMEVVYPSRQRPGMMAFVKKHWDKENPDAIEDANLYRYRYDNAGEPFEQETIIDTVRERINLMRCQKEGTGIAFEYMKWRAEQGIELVENADEAKKLVAELKVAELERPELKGVVNEPPQACSLPQQRASQKASTPPSADNVLRSLSTEKLSQELQQKILQIQQEQELPQRQQPAQQKLNAAVVILIRDAKPMKVRSRTQWKGMMKRFGLTPFQILFPLSTSIEMLFPSEQRARVNDFLEERKQKENLKVIVDPNPYRRHDGNLGDPLAPESIVKNVQKRIYMLSYSGNPIGYQFIKWRALQGIDILRDYRLTGDRVTDDRLRDERALLIKQLTDELNAADLLHQHSNPSQTQQ